MKYSLVFALFGLWGATLFVSSCGDDDSDPPGGDSDAVDPDGGDDSDNGGSLDEQVEEILAGLSLEDKIGQMAQGQFEDASTTLIRSMCIGSVFSGGEEPVNPNNPENWAAEIDIKQQAALDGCGVPILYGIDAVHGNGKVIGSTVFPHNISFGAANDLDLTERVGQAVGRECRGAGIHMTFAPAVSVVRDERWGRTYEGFGETPELNAELGAAYIRGLQGMGDLSDPGAVAATAKHFVGDGGTVDGRNNGTNLFGEDTMRSVHLPPYLSAVESGVAAVMPSYHGWERDDDEIFMTQDSYLLTDVLKGELDFGGFVLSDYDAIPRAGGTGRTPYTVDNVAVAVNAGVDMAMIAMRGGIGDFTDSVYTAVDDGVIDEERINDAVRRILRIKLQMNLFENPFSNPELRADIWSETHQELAREAVQKSLVLLKNDNDALPLDADSEVTLAGPFADMMGAQAGGWTVGWQGTIDYTEDHVMGETIRTGMADIGGDNLVWDGRAESVADAEKIVVVVGENPYAEGEGDHGQNENSVNLADQPNYEVLSTAMESDAQIVLVILSGRPLVIDDAVLSRCDAIVAAWLPGSRGRGVADVLYGDVNFSGKLPHTWPASFEQIPINVDLKSDEPGVDAEDVTPLFPLGHGLTY